MDKNLYSKFNKEKILLRDFLAIDRTILANERTFLAYMRTALTIFIAGVSFIKFFGHLIFEIIGWIFIPAGIITFLIGFVRYKKFTQKVNRLNQ